jgi:hypothetical protein
VAFLLVRVWRQGLPAAAAQLFIAGHAPWIVGHNLALTFRSGSLYFANADLY